MYQTGKKIKPAGFTLIETLLVVAISSVVALAIYSTFNSGLKIWQRLTKKEQASDLNIFFEKIAYDLRNSFKFSDIKFVGKQDSIGFASLVMTQIGQQQMALGVGQAGYCFDAQTESLNRWQLNYSELYQNKPAHLRQILNNVKALSFRYYYYDPEEEAYMWKDLWIENEEGIPLAVRIKMEFGKDAECKEVTRTVAIPAGG